MKRLIKMLFTSLTLLAWSATSSWAQALSFDENGNGYEIVRNFDYSLTTNRLPYAVEPDPSYDAGTGPLVLVYSLPADCLPVVNGDVAFADTNSSGGVSHLVRFLNPGTVAIFYANDGTHSLADLGYIPPTLSTNAVTISDRWPSATSWNPMRGQPGFSNESAPVWGLPFGYTFFTESSVPVGSNGTLFITYSPPDVIVTWPTNLTNFVLCQNTYLSHSGWATVTNTPDVLPNGQYQVRISGPLSGTKFFRLRSP